MWVKTIFWSLCYPRLRDGLKRAFYAKTSKMNCSFTSLGALLFNCPSWIFYMLYYNSRAFLRCNNSSKIPCTKPWFFSFKVSQNFIVYESAEDRNLRAFFKRVKNSLSCNILPNSTVTGMPYVPAKDELVSLNCLSSRWLWKWYNSNVLDRRLYGVGQHFTFCRFSRKRKFFGNFDCDFRKNFTKGFFLTEYKGFQNFLFDSKFSIFSDSRS